MSFFWHVGRVAGLYQCAAAQAVVGAALNASQVTDSVADAGDAVFAKWLFWKESRYTTLLLLSSSPFLLL
jgi:hypothetical protein